LSSLEIDLKKLTHNYKSIRNLLEPRVKMIGVVKANAYGSAIDLIANKLVALGVDALAVAYTNEGAALRKAGIKVPIIIFYPQVHNFKNIIEQKLEPALYSKRSWVEFKKLLKESQSSNYPVHVKYNTGLNRIGFDPKEIDWVIAELKHSPIKLKSIYSHLGATEANRPDQKTNSQIELFKEIISKHKKNTTEKIDFHLLNTSGIFNYPDFHLDWVRTGIGLYGFANHSDWNKKLKPIASLKTTITQIHKISKGVTVGYNCGWTALNDTKIAVIPLGHADGIARHYGHKKGWVLINGKKAPMVGNICMDMTMVEIGEINCEEGDEVVVFGGPGRADLLAEDLGTISYELLSGLGSRITRKVIE
tara:strand:- start:1259 stop:2347 length:1089 start_codon:yes stop_codon:yes gene_type:complete